ESIWEKLNKKISTRDINTFFFDVIRQAPAPSFRGNDIKFFYITQTRQRPPSFMTYVNEPRGVTNAYKRFVAAKIKDHYGMEGIPIRIYPKKRKRSGEGLTYGRHAYGHHEGDGHEGDDNEVCE